MATVAEGLLGLAVYTPAEPKMRHTLTPRLTEHDPGSAPTRDIDPLVRDYAAAPYPILLLGQTGTGKSSLAREIHRLSPRAARPFVECAVTSVSDELGRAELLGFARGSFTGAYHDHAGAIESAHSGTLFLDEIGHASPRVQQTLLGTIEGGVIRRIGEVRQRPVDVRLICATSADLGAMCRAGLFLAELLYRIDCLTIELAPLRNRRNEIIPRALGYLSEAYADLRRDFTPTLSDEAAACLRNAPWPGNLRQLRSACQYVATRLTVARPIFASDLPDHLRLPGPRPFTDDRERARAILANVHGNKSKAASVMGISRPSLYRLLADAPDTPEV